MFELFKIIYFTPFYFPNGNPAKNKYFIPIAQFDDQFVFASLPTSKDSVPDSLLQHGCINVPEKLISCYVFFKDIPITECGFCFERNTFIYYTQILKLPLTILNETYTKIDVDYSIIGELNKKEKLDLIECLLLSPNVNQKIKRFLKTFKETNF